MAGLECLRRGGNAIDAAVTAAAVLGVVEPYSTGIGGDCFMLVWAAGGGGGNGGPSEGGRLHGLNGSGRAPAAATLEEFTRRGLAEMPFHGMLPVTVPGAVDAWCEALARFGTRSLAEVLEPAIAYAEEGFAVSEVIQHEWSLCAAAGILRRPDAARRFTVDGEAPRLGAVFRLPDLARSLRLLAGGGRDVFYRGELAERLARFSRDNDGLLSAADLAEHRSSWVEPISTEYRGHRLFELPPNGQGLTALIALNILECFDVAAHPLDSAETWHLRIEAINLAFADRARFIADPEHARLPVAELLSKDYAQGRAALIHPHKVLSNPPSGPFRAGTDTVYLTTADARGNVVSLINSLYAPFGSGMVAGDTGICLQNRGRGFVLDPAHPNCIAPRKRPFHTIIPAMLFRDGRPLVSFGVMGGDVQPQGHLQVVSNLVDFGLNIQEALDEPRFNFLQETAVAVEESAGEGIRQGLIERGHTVGGEFAALARGGFGGGQGILIDPATGCYWGGSDRRKDGCAAGW
jgi:gamma-glutamyltranspeptidase/glutathione hydrolase